MSNKDLMKETYGKEWGFVDGKWKSYIGVPMSDELITEQTGYLSTKEQVERLIFAGDKLDQIRHSDLDSYDEDDEDQDASVIYERDPVELREDLRRRVRYRKRKDLSKADKKSVLDPVEGKGEEKNENPSTEDIGESKGITR